MVVEEDPLVSGTGGARWTLGGVGGGGDSGNNGPMQLLTMHGVNSGSGGGGADETVNRYGGGGGSGIVLIAYPT